MRQKGSPRKVLAKALALESCSEFIVRIETAISRRGGLTEGHINAPRQCPALRHAAQTREAELCKRYRALINRAL